MKSFEILSTSPLSLAGSRYKLLISMAISLPSQCGWIHHLFFPRALTFSVLVSTDREKLLHKGSR